MERLRTIILQDYYKQPISDNRLNYIFDARVCIWLQVARRFVGFRKTSALGRICGYRKAPAYVS